MSTVVEISLECVDSKSADLDFQLRSSLRESHCAIEGSLHRMITAAAAEIVTHFIHQVNYREHLSPICRQPYNWLEPLKHRFSNQTD